VDLGGHLAGAGGGERREEIDDGRPGGARGLGHEGARPRRRELAAGGAERLEERRRRLRPDAGDEAEHAQAGHGVARVLGEAQKRHEVFDVRHLDEAQPAVLVKGDVAARELHLQRHRMVLGAEQHGLLLELRALLAVLQDARAEPLRLLVVVAAGGEHWAAAAGALGPELLVAALGGLRDERVGGRHDGACGAVVARQRAHLGPRKAQLEIEDVAHRGGAEGVDGLGVVADAGDAGAARAQQRDDVGLQSIRILKLVDQHVIEAFTHAGAAGRIGEEPAPEEQQVVVVEHLLLLFEVGVAGEELGQALFGRQAPGERRVQHLVQRQLGVDAARVHIEAGGLLGEAGAAAAEAERGAGDVHEVFRVAPVHDREVRLHADVAGVDAQQAGGRGVEGAAPDARGGAA